MSRAARRLALVTLAGLASLLPAIGPGSPASGQTSDPNILVIVTDDQRAMDTMEHMPRTVEWFGQGGTTFTEGFVTTPLCCPSRAAIMTGRLNHNNNVRTNGDQELLDHNSTIARYLNQAGYRTGLAGKFLNLWPVANNPPNYDRWALLRPESTGYFNSQFNVDGTVQTVPEYSTDYIGDYVLEVLGTWEASNDNQPWFLHVAPYAPHDPADPAQRHASATFPPWPGNPAVFETDKSDKPPSVRRAPRTYEEALVDRERQLRTLLAVDEMVDGIFDELQATGEQNTLAFFLSDNGFFWAEHGLRGKNRPYTEAIKVPFFVRWPGHVPAGGTHGSPVANIDIVPTIMDATGINPAPPAVDGRSLLKGGARTKMLAESWPPESRGPWASTRTPAYQYMEYYNRDTGAVQFREYYDLTTDPFQLNNLYGDRTPRNDPWFPTLARELKGLKQCRGARCLEVMREPSVSLRCPGAASKPGHHLVGWQGRDSIGGAPWRNVVCGLEGDDSLRGKGGRDRLIGHGGDDTLVGGPGDDLLVGKGGRDICRGGPGKDQFRGCERRSA